MLLTVNNNSTCPQYNLALEEYLCSRNLELFMLWQNEPSVIIGRFCDVNHDVNIDAGIQIIRRNSGGGSVYHDLGNINYSFILKDKREYTLEFFSDIIINALNVIGINAELSFRHNDILADGMKISGAAQYHHDGIILHHGTLLFDSNLEAMKRILRRSGNVANIKPLMKDNLTVNEMIAFMHDNISALTLTLKHSANIANIKDNLTVNDIIALLRDNIESFGTLTLKHSGNIADMKHNPAANDIVTLMRENIASPRTLTLTESDESRIKTLMLSKYLNPKWNLKGVNLNDKV